MEESLVQLYAQENMQTLHRALTAEAKVVAFQKQIAEMSAANEEG